MDISTYRTALETTLRGSLPGNALSHPGRSLIDHSIGTLNLAYETAKRHKLTQIQNILSAAAFHDIAKSQNKFQRKITGESNSPVPHSAPSAACVWSYIPNQNSKETLFGIAEPICRHHTGMENWNTAAATWQSGKMVNYADNLRPVLHDADSKKLSDVGRLFLFDPEEIPEFRAEAAELWLTERLSLSVLAASDRLDALGVRKLPESAMPKIREKIFERTGPMDDIRDKYYKACHHRLFEVVRGPGCYTLTLPTGSGKTNIGFTCAARIAEKNNMTGIIYTLPFISVIEQCVNFAKELFGEENVQEDHSHAYINNEEDKVRVLFRYWDSPIVVTTLHMLYGTIFNPKATAAINFHKLANSVVILDEPQGMDPHHWAGFHRTLEFIASKLNTVFLIMTATQPYMDKNYNEIAAGIKLRPPVRRGYKFLNSVYRLESLEHILKTEIPYFTTQSGMIVMNTRVSALRAYYVLKPILESYGEVFFLSTLMTPLHRKQTIERMKEKLRNGENCYLIATQVVETGVDISFDFVLRDFAPLNSIVQIGGRCNRNAYKYGQVVIAEFENDSGRRYSQMIYDTVSISKTKEILKTWDGKPESIENELLEQYNRTLHKGLKESELWTNIERGKWGEFIPLYKDKENEVSVYIDTGGVKELLSELESIDKGLESLYKIKKLRRELSQYEIKVREKWIPDSDISNIQKMRIRGQEIYYVPARADSIYDSVCGYKPEL